MTWRHFHIGQRADQTIRVYAPNLLAAFSIARTYGFGSATITCFGSEAKS